MFWRSVLPLKDRLSIYCSTWQKDKSLDCLVLNAKVILSPEISVTIYQSSQHTISEDMNLQHCYGNLKVSWKINFIADSKLLVSTWAKFGFLTSTVNPAPKKEKDEEEEKAGAKYTILP